MYGIRRIGCNDEFARCVCYRGDVAGVEVRSEAHGPHWVAWVPGKDGKPQDSVILVGQTREEAEERAKRWAERIAQTR